MAILIILKRWHNVGDSYSVLVLLALCIAAIDNIHVVREALAGFNLTLWKVLGRQLGLGEELLDEIKADYQRDGVRECLNQVLAHWLKRNYREAKFGGRPTWENLANAVKRSDDRALADKIWAEH